jgi:hypothetical protein
MSATQKLNHRLSKLTAAAAERNGIVVYFRLGLRSCAASVYIEELEWRNGIWLDRPTAPIDGPEVLNSLGWA